jgi:iron complex transport system permease protein
MGVNTKKLENILYFITALVCGLSVYIAGIIAFVGLVSPQLVKFLYRKNLHRKLFVPNILMGASLLVFSDVIAVALSKDTMIPTGGVISLIGAPFLIYLIGRGRVNG